MNKANKYEQDIEGNNQGNKKNKKSKKPKNPKQEESKVEDPDAKFAQDMEKAMKNSLTVPEAQKNESNSQNQSPRTKKWKPDQAVIDSIVSYFKEMDLKDDGKSSYKIVDNDVRNMLHSMNTEVDKNAENRDDIIIEKTKEHLLNKKKKQDKIAKDKMIKFQMNRANQIAQMQANMLLQQKEKPKIEKVPYEKLNELYPDKNYGVAVDQVSL